MEKDTSEKQEITPAQREERLNQWGRAIALEKARQDLEATTPPPQEPPLEEQPTFVADEEKKELDRVA